ncbi:MAG: HD-GYP domain-containing protein [Vicinamibacterales bacterium]
MLFNRTTDGYCSVVAPGAENLFAALAARRPREAEHSRRVSAYAIRLASQYGLSASMLETIGTGALLHDVGKLIVSGRILDKPARLNRREWVALESHPRAGAELVEDQGLGNGIAEIVLHHHERIDGGGYPDRLAGRAIPWMVRIVTVMDAFDALTSPRQYRRALSIDAARSLIAREAGLRFCPWVVAGLMSLPHSLLQPPQTVPAAYVQDGLASEAAKAATEGWQGRQGAASLSVMMA